MGWITGLIFFLLEKENKFVRFHAMQSMLTFLGLFVIMFVLGFIPLVNLFLVPIIGLASMVLWIVLMIKAYKGEEFKLPIVGEIAAKQINQ